MKLCGHSLLHIPITYLTDSVAISTPLSIMVLQLFFQKLVDQTDAA